MTSGARSKLYLAGPLFNDAEREFKIRLCSILSDRFDVYVPHVDGLLLPDLLSAGFGVEDAYKRIFLADVSAINLCDVFFAILNGRVIDEGVAFELGVAWNLGKVCVGYKDDFRQLTAVGDNPMIKVAISSIFSSVLEVRRWVQTAHPNLSIAH